MTRQGLGPFSKMTLFVPPPAGAGLGTSMAACTLDGGVFYAMAPGARLVFDLKTSGLPDAFPTWGMQPGTGVACAEPPGATFAVVSTGDSLKKYLGGAGWSTIGTGSFVAVAAQPGPVIAAINGAHVLSTWDVTSGANLYLVTLGTTTPETLAWFGSELLVGEPGQGRVLRFSMSTSQPQPAGQLTGGAGFGRALAFGNVHPSPGPELCVSRESQVFVYALDGGLLMTLDGGPTLGASLAVEKGAYLFPDGGVALDALWVGEPGQMTVHRYIGSRAASAQTAIPTFGASILALPADVVVGAPQAGAGGELYRLPAFFNAVPRRIGVPVMCPDGHSCSVSGGCTGTCVGNVVCDCQLGFDGGPTGDGGAADAGVADAGMDAGAADAGAADAGVVDAGVVDAGAADAGVADAGVDAGVVDAGAADAGAADAGAADAGAADAGASDAGILDGGANDAGAGPAGPLVFGTCGCSGGTLPSLGLALLSLTALRRRRSP